MIDATDPLNTLEAVCRAGAIPTVAAAKETKGTVTMKRDMTQKQFDDACAKYGFRPRPNKRACYFLASSPSTSVWLRDSVAATRRGQLAYLIEQDKKAAVRVADEKLRDAAPDLLEACQSIVAWFDEWSVEIGPAETALLDVVRVAITKAIS